MQTIAGRSRSTEYAGWRITVWREPGGWAASIVRTLPPLNGERPGPLPVSGGPWPTPEEASAAATARCDAEDLPG